MTGIDTGGMKGITTTCRVLQMEVTTVGIAEQWVGVYVPLSGPTTLNVTVCDYGSTVVHRNFHALCCRVSPQDRICNRWATIPVTANPTTAIPSSILTDGGVADDGVGVAIAVNPAPVLHR